jgi:hypothetical protein
MGDCHLWVSATVTVSDGKMGMHAMVHAQDEQDFNGGGAKGIRTGEPDSINGRFETIGWAKPFYSYGSMTTDMAWTRGSINTSSQIGESAMTSLAK